MPSNSQLKKQPRIKIRLATIDDLAAVFHLGEALFTPQDVSNLYRTWNEFEVTGLFNNSPDYMLVAIAGQKKVVGFAIGNVIEKRGSAWTYGHLLWLGVDPAFAGLGVGSMLFERFRRIMDNDDVRMLIIDTQADNDGALEFFKRKGFANPIDHVYMTLNLDETP